MDEGEIYKVKAPFLKEKCDWMDSGFRWVHGIVFNTDGEYCENGYADSEGYAEFEVIKIVDLPEPYKKRVFFRRRLTNPDGITEKWRALEVLGEIAFKNVRNGKKWKYETE